MTSDHDIAIVGGGIAGAAVLHHLSRRGSARCVLIERENLPGVHASGRNAAMVRQNVPDPVHRILAQRSVAFYRDPVGFPQALEYREVGSLLLYGPEAEAAAPIGGLESRSLDVQSWTPEQAAQRVPLLQPQSFARAEFCASDGVIDVHGLLQGFLQSAHGPGCEIRLDTELQSVHRDRSGLFELKTNRGTLRARRLVNAAGAWCMEVGKLCGSPVSGAMQPHRRHLFVTSPIQCVDPRWPFTWDLHNEFYMRPESGGVLFSPCDEAAAQPGCPPCRAEAEELALVKIARFLPELLESSIAYRWAGLRTLPADGHFTLGADPKVENLFWAGGLGGHGITTAFEVGRMVADVIDGVERSEDAELLRSMAPARWLSADREEPGG